MASSDPLKTLRRDIVDPLKAIRQGVEVWNKWRLDNSGVRPDLRGVDFTGAGLRDAGLRGAVLIGANLIRAKLTGADLREVDLTGANLTGADLHEAKLTGANLPGAELRRARLRKADLTGANLTEAVLTWANVTEAVLRKAGLTGANLTGANLTGANLTGADLHEAVLIGANLTEARLRKADLTGADLRRARLRKADLTGADLRNTYLEETSLSEGRRDSIGSEGILSIPLRDHVTARELGKLMRGLSILYNVACTNRISECENESDKELIACKVSIGTPNLADLVGILPEITAIAAALVAVLQIPKAFAEGAKGLAEARKTWIEGTLLKPRPNDKSEHQITLSDQQINEIAVAFNELYESRELIRGRPIINLENIDQSEQIISANPDDNSEDIFS